MRALLSIIVGIIILHSVAREKARLQRRELNLQKILGASFADLRNMVRLEFGTLGLFSSLLGISLSLISSFLISSQIFDRVWIFQWSIPLMLVFGVTAVTCITAELSTKKFLKEKPLDLFRGD